MALPSNFNTWSHFISVITQVQNRIIREDFNDVGDDSWEPNITTDRASLRVACTIRANDSAPLVLLRLMLYYIILRKAQDLQIPYYGIPVGALAAQRKHRPQVFLYFSQDSLEVAKNENPVTGEISYRLMDETSESISQTKIELIANKIKSEFGAGAGFVWRKGKLLLSYTDWDEGLQLQILCRSKEEGERVIRAVLAVHDATFDAKKMGKSENESPGQRYPNIPERQNILGKNVELPRQRPLIDVRFRYATLALHGLKKPIHLYDRTLRLTDVIVR